ncbi:MAG: magnesium-translocating P-type ATPase [Anaerolineales bacterium]
MPESPFWSQPIDAAFQALNSAPGGLSASQAQSQLEKYGPNRIAAKEKASPLGLFWSQFKSPIMLILIFATLVSAFLRDWVDAVIILLIVLGSALLSFFQEYNANNAAEKLKSQVALKSDVRRAGLLSAVPADEIVPGDVVSLSAGSLVPADGLVITAKDFFVNQAVLTGETFPVEKKPGVAADSAGLAERTNVVFMGTNVQSGSAEMLVVQTGRQTNFGQIAHRLTLRPPETEFERGIKRLGFLLSEVMFILVLGIFALNVYFQKPVLDSLLFSIALAVGLTPQLLPAIININLSRGSQDMARRGVIVRRLESIENFGSMNVLCTDKTGTLTVGVVSLDATLDPQGAPSDQVHLLAFLNASLQTGLNNPLDQAIVQPGGVAGGAYTKVDEIPYDFIRKRLSVVVDDGLGQHTLITKGALDNVLAVCTHVQGHTSADALDKPRRDAIQAQFQAWSAQGYRVLGVAAKPVSAQAQSFSQQDETGLTFMGFLLFLDPPKPGVQATIAKLEELGVTLKIITGDNRLVAQHTGQVIGLGDFKLLTGSELDDLRDEALWHAVEQTTIFAEVDPNQKERIILALKKRGNVVGYLGDGINDAPSLHSADVGISVDNAVDVAKDAADLVLLKQDLDVLREGILQGRKTFANTLKYVFMATSANFGNMFSMAGASLFLPFLPMLPKQILLINFLTDLPEMSIASDNVDDVFLMQPHRWNIAFIRRFMLVFGSLSSFFDFATFALLMWVMQADQQVFQTGWFIESVLSAGLVVFAIRTRLPVQHSRPSRTMLLITLAVAVVALALPYLPIAGLLGFTPLPPQVLLSIFGIVAVYFLAAEFAKRWFYRTFTV